MESPIIENNSLFLNETGVWVPLEKRDFSYSDGEEIETYLKSVVSKASDLSSMSNELEAAAKDWASTYHLSSQRANILHGLKLQPGQNILELGCGCGAITRFLAESGALIDAVEGSPVRAEIARLRNRDMDNVNVINVNFNSLILPEKAYDAIILVGVLEYAEKYFKDKDQPKNIDAVASILAILKKVCKPQGFLFIAIENRIGLKYWLGATEDHFGSPFYGLYGYPANDGIKTFDKAQWDRLIEGSQFNHHRYLYPFPDYKIAQTVLSDEFIRKDPYAYSILYRISATDYARPGWIPSCDEFLTWRALQGSGYLEQFANSFCILLSDSIDFIQECSDFDFIHFSNRHREAAYRVITKKQKNETVVRKKSLSSSHEPSKGKSAQRIEETTPYFSGPLLSTMWLDAIMYSEDPKIFENLLRHYASFISEMSSDDEHKRYIFDYLPFNIIQDDSGKYCIIEREWWFEEDLTPNFILFRALYLFAFENKNLIGKFCNLHQIETIRDFIAYWFTILGLQASEIPILSEIEQRITEKLIVGISGNQMNRILCDIINADVAMSCPNQDGSSRLYWKGVEAGNFREQDSVIVRTNIGFERQTIRFRIFQSVRSMTSLRFDPFEHMGCFQIYSLTVIRSNTKRPGIEEILLEINNPEQISQLVTLIGIFNLKTALYNLYIATNNDPNVVLTLPKGLVLEDSDSYFIVKLEVSLSMSIDGYFQFSRLCEEIDHLTKSVNDKASRITSLTRQVADKERHIQSIQNHITDKERHIQSLEKRIADREYILRQLSEKSVEVKIQKQLVDLKQNHIINLEATIDQFRHSRAIRLATFIHTLVKNPFGWIGKGTDVSEKSDMLETQPCDRAVPVADERHFGIKADNYQLWLNLNLMSEDLTNSIQKEIQTFANHPLISVLMPVYNVDIRWLERAIESVNEQFYEHWELCIVDDCSFDPKIKETLERYAQEDPRIKVKILDRNHGIAMATNHAARLATGEYLGLLDHDDELSRDALFECAKAINRFPGVSLIYSDEDKMDLEGNCIEPFFKPDFSFDQLMSQNYICHFSVIRRKIFDRIGGFRDGLNGSQDHDLLLRVVQSSTRVHHIPKILYHWRKIPGSTAALFDSKSYAWEAGRKAVEDALNRSPHKGKVFGGRFQGSYHVKRNLVDRPLISIIIPFRDQANFLQLCVNSILEKTTYDNFEILLADNRSEETETRKLLENFTLLDPRIRQLTMDFSFNYSKINNLAVREARGKHIVLMNNDIQIITPNWIEALLEHSQRNDIGAVGAKLLYPNHIIQHAGVVIGIYGNAGHCHKLMPADDIGYYARPHITHNVSAVTAALLMVEKSKFDAVDGLEAEHLTVAYNDVDFCLKLMEKGFKNIYTPYCEAIHHESATRGYETTPDRLERFNKEKEFFETKWHHMLKTGDPFYNPNLTLDSENYDIKLPSEK
jgi:O-antigen biosynthesis protein